MYGIVLLIGARERRPLPKGETMTERYNGYANRETWAMSLWLNNDQQLGADFKFYVRDQHEDRLHDEAPTQWWVWGGADMIARSWADIMMTRSGYEHEFSGPMPAGLQDMALDVGSLWRIDWFEVLESVFEGDQD